MRGRLGIVVCAALTSACGPPLAGDDEIGDDASTSETSTSESSTSESSTDESSTDDTEETEDASTTEGDGCGGFSIDPEFIAPNVMLVVDTSSSMVLETWDHDGDPLTTEVTRWSSARTLVELLVAEFGESMNLGVQRFPSEDACPGATLESANCTDSDVCSIAAAPEVAAGIEQGPAILASLPASDAGAVEIVGGSPTSAAFLAARDHLLELPASVPSYIVLITDGGANCGEGLGLPESFEVYDDLLADNVGQAFAFDQISTFVVGVDIDSAVGMAGQDSPEVDAFAALNQVALAGGIPWQSGMDPQKFFDVRDSEDLFDVMRRPEGITDCTVDLTFGPDGLPAPRQIPLVSIVMDGVEVPRVEDCETQEGWTWIVEGEILSFCGSWCELFKDGAAVEGDYGCPSLDGP
jgi:hypothetical protein